MNAVRFSLVTLFCLGVLWLPLPAASGAEEPADVLRAGTARREITPAKPVMLAGYASRKELSQGVHDPISVRIVAFRQNGRKLVLVSTDIIGFYGGTAARMRKTILEACGLQPSELFLAAIHTHSIRSSRSAARRSTPTTSNTRSGSKRSWSPPCGRPWTTRFRCRLPSEPGLLLWA